MTDGASRTFNPSQSLIRTSFSIAVTALLMAAYYTWPEPLALWDITADPERTAMLGTAVATLFWISLAYSLNLSVTTFVWNSPRRRRSGIPVPKLLTQLVGLGLWLGTAIVVMAVVYDVPIAGFLTTSGIIIAVIGFALRNLIADVFTGIALGIEQPLHIGDWIQFDGEEPGKVVEINWRAARLITLEDISVVVPNSQLATNAFRNFSRPSEFWRDTFDIVMPYDVTYRQAERILLSAVAQVPESANIPRQPDVLIEDYTERGTRWRLRYWVKDYPSRARTRYEIQRNVLRNLHYAGIEVPHAKMDVFNGRHTAQRQDEEREDVDFLNGISPLSPLTAEELRELASKMRRRLCMTGQPVVHQGEEGDSLFVVKEGTLEVSIANEAGLSTIVGRLNPGMFFAEMSLLTGAPRSATVVPSVDTVVFEITRDDLVPLMSRRPALADQLSEVLAERQMRNTRILSEQSDSNPMATQVTMAQQFLGSIQTFFGMHRDGTIVPGSRRRASS